MGLEDYVKDRLVSYELPRSLDALMELSTQVDGRIQARHREKRQGPLEWHSPVSLPTPLKQEVGSMLVSHTSNLSPDSRPLCQARLLLSEGSHTLAVFIDSGSDINIIDEELARQLNIQRVPLPHPSPACALNGQLVGTVTHQTTPLRLLLSGNHHETIQFHILKSPRLPFILGFPWLHRHNPTIDWSTGSILGWSSACHQVCLKQASAPRLTTCSDPAPNMVGVPAVYTDFREVFSKAKANSLPPHRPYDCAIDLQLGSSPPRGRLFSLSVPERKAMEEYIGDSLAAGIIHPSVLLPGWHNVLLCGEEGQDPASVY